jgi:prepilin-type processing-associated H-X9-DG protein
LAASSSLPWRSISFAQEFVLKIIEAIQSAASPVGAPFGSSTASPLKLTKLYQSSITWAICEYDLQLAQTSGHVNPTTKLWLYPILPSHDKGRNVVYFDGHAETLPLNTQIADPIY